MPCIFRPTYLEEISEILLLRTVKLHFNQATLKTLHEYMYSRLRRFNIRKTMQKSQSHNFSSEDYDFNSRFKFCSVLHMRVSVMISSSLDKERYLLCLRCD